MNNKIELLRGHTSAETAYIVDDYPYGFRLRCKIRYWLEEKKNHGTRLVSQTTNPKRGDVWNKPKASTYASGLAFMYLDAQGHLTWEAQGPNGIEGFADKRERFAFNEAETQELGIWEKISRKFNPTCWATVDGKAARLAGQPLDTNPHAVDGESGRYNPPGTCHERWAKAWLEAKDEAAA